MTVVLATKTLLAISRQMESDQGAAFRVAQGKTMPHMHDAYRGEDEGFRSHLGASVVGKECDRSIWYDWRWYRKPKFEANTLRLFNRGHLEEARFLAMFLAIGCQVYQQDGSGKQFRVSDAGGHFGGSTDGVIIGIPDLPINTPCLSEFKTHNDKSFNGLVSQGVRVAKFEHFVQMQIYMHKMGLKYAIYCAVNKNNDHIYMEIISWDAEVAERFIDRGKKLIFMRQVPDRLQYASKGFHKCKYCNNKGICFDDEEPHFNCRTCAYSVPLEDGTWSCTNARHDMPVISKELQLTGCALYERL